MRCPACNIDLEGLGRWCSDCQAYTADLDCCTCDCTPENRTDSNVPFPVQFIIPWHRLASDNLRNSRRGGRGHGWDYKRARSDIRRLTEHGAYTEGPVRVSFTFFPPDRRRRDCTNFLKVLLDGMQSNVYRDDSQVIAGRWLVLAPDRANPRVEVRVDEGEKNG